MVEAGKLLILLGILVVLAGVVVWTLGRWGFHGLPGDVRAETPQVRLYIPIVTCIALSLLATALLWLWQWFGRR